MRLSELSGKEIVDLKNGERMGVLGQTDVLIDEESGHIRAFIIPTLKWMGLKKTGEEAHVKWEQIKTIGSDMMIIDLKEK